MTNSKIQIIGQLFAVLITTVMVAMSSILNEKEIVFPEIAALVTGALCTPRQPWNVSKPRFVLIMSVSAVVGVLLSALPVIMIFKIIFGFIYSALALYLFKCTLVPVISACILPVLMGTTGWVYPVTVFILSAIIVIVQLLLEKGNLRDKNEYKNDNIAVKKYACHWFVLLCFLSVYAIYPCVSGRLLLLAPPLIVMFCEFMSGEKRFDNKETKIFIQVVLCGITGAVCRYVFCVALPLGEIVAVLVIQLIIYALFSVMKCYFPPAAALSILPLIIDESQIIYYPFYITITSAIITIVSLIKRNCTNIKTS